MPWSQSAGTGLPSIRRLAVQTSSATILQTLGVVEVVMKYLSSVVLVLVLFAKA